MNYAYRYLGKLRLQDLHTHLREEREAEKLIISLQSHNVSIPGTTRASPVAHTDQARPPAPRALAAPVKMGMVLFGAGGVTIGGAVVGDAVVSGGALDDGAPVGVAVAGGGLAAGGAEPLVGTTVWEGVGTRMVAESVLKSAVACAASEAVSEMSVVAEVWYEVRVYWTATKS